MKLIQNGVELICGIDEIFVIAIELEGHLSMINYRPMNKASYKETMFSSVGFAYKRLGEIRDNFPGYTFVLCTLNNNMLKRWPV